MKYKGYDVIFKRNNYADNGNLYVGLDYFDTELDGYFPYGDITVNLFPLPKMCAAIDTNNMGTSILSFIEEIGLAENTGEVMSSGFCVYPIYRFNEIKLNELCNTDW